MEHAAGGGGDPPPWISMKPDPIHPDDAKLGALLREGRASPVLPPRFQEAVWRRIEEAEAGAGRRWRAWLDRAVLRVMRPRLALAAIAAVMVAGAILGARDGAQFARQDARAHYLAAVAPNPLR
jgi:hypothetical protein